MSFPNLSPANSLRSFSRSPRDEQDDNFALGQMNWLLGSSGGTAKTSSVTSLYSYGSTQFINERPKPRSRSASIKFSERTVDIHDATEQSDANDFLSNGIKVCTENIFGLYGVEVWQYDRNTGKLVNVTKSTESIESGRCGCGIHIKRIPQEADQQSPNYSPEARDAFERLTHKSRMDYLASEPVESGRSLAGALWSETSTSGTLDAVTNGVLSIGSTIHKRVGLLVGSQPTQSADIADTIFWRELEELVADPNQPYDERIQLMSQAGFKIAAGIPINIHGFHGIILFLANPHCDRRKLGSQNNTQLIKRSAQYIAAAVALQNPIAVAAGRKSNHPVENWKRLRLKILAVVRFQKPIITKRTRMRRSRSGSFVVTLKRIKSMSSMSTRESFQLLSDAAIGMKNNINTALIETTYAVKARRMKYLTKLKGGNASIPPAMPFVQCLWTFVGIVTTLFVLARIDEFVVQKTSGQLSIVLPPIGALTTTQWNLTAAPASQPRNAVFSQIIALLTAFSLHQISCIGQPMRCALAPAITAALTAKLGIVHAPAGASALAFSINKYNLGHQILFLFGVSIAIVVAVAMNNLSDKRQYPTSWPLLNKCTKMYG